MLPPVEYWTAELAFFDISFRNILKIQRTISQLPNKVISPPPPFLQNQFCLKQENESFFPSNLFPPQSVMFLGFWDSCLVLDQSKIKVN